MTEQIESTEQTEQQPLRTNHNIRIVNLTTSQSVLCLFGDVRDEDKKVVGYRMLYPYVLSLGDVNTNGTIPINYTRWCPFSPVEEHRISGEHIISVVYPDNNILDNYTEKLKEVGLEQKDIFFEVTDGTESEPAEASE
jgi:hypothetical protein|tara:strand:+ start:1415 stop:1828 length:414 start_codon:yes stop_codon:yes gene_type:complete